MDCNCYHRCHGIVNIAIRINPGEMAGTSPPDPTPVAKKNYILQLICLRCTNLRMNWSIVYSLLSE